MSAHKTALALSLILGAFAAQTDAATLIYDVRSSASDSQISGTVNDQNRRSNVALGGTFATVTSAAQSENETSAAVSVNAATGTIKFAASAVSRKAGDDLSPSINRAVSTMEMTLTETFAATGSGTATFLLALDGVLTDDTPANGNARYDLTLSFAGGSGSLGADRVFGSTEFLGAGDHVIAELISISFFVPVAQNITMRLSFLAEADAQSNGTERQTGNGADFLNTAVLSFTTTSGLSLTASDPAFLSGAPAVPLPASLPLLLAGFGGLALARRRTRR